MLPNLATKTTYQTYRVVAFYLDSTFFCDPKIFTRENMCHNVEQMFLSDIFFRC